MIMHQGLNPGDYLFRSTVYSGLVHFISYHLAGQTNVTNSDYYTVTTWAKYFKPMKPAILITEWHGAPRVYKIPLWSI